MRFSSLFPSRALHRPRSTRLGRGRVSDALIVAAFATVAMVPLTASASSSGEFIVKCSFDHAAGDDPIVVPGRPGASHSHDFYGSKGVNAFSTASSLQGATSTCGLASDTAAYWQPTLLTDCSDATDSMPTQDCKTALQPAYMKAYYYGSDKTRPFPPAYRIVAGNKNATSPQGSRVVYWGCGHDSALSKTDTLPQCPVGGILEAHIKFPDCWDGTTHLDGEYAGHVSSDGQTHGNGTCPTGFPVHIPSLVMAIVWNATPAPVQTMLASGSTYGLHGDYWSAWQPRTLEGLVASCLNTNTDCGTVKTPAG
jgi:hypothetical protein